MAVNVLIIRAKFDDATKATYQLGDGLSQYLQGKGLSVTDLADADATPAKVADWLDFTKSNVNKLVIAFDHGSTSGFYGEQNNSIAAVIDKSNVESLVKGLHVYTFACLTNASGGLGETAIQKGCYSWLGYTDVASVLYLTDGTPYQPFVDCIWSYIKSLADGKTIDDAEATLKQAYKDRFDLHPVFKSNYDILLLRKKQAGMTINSHNRIAAKSFIKDSKDISDFKSKDFKDIKDNKSEFKEIKDHKPEKNEMDYQKAFEGFQKQSDTGQITNQPDITQITDIHQRLAQMEATVGQLSTFITAAMRPDLSIGALQGESDAGRKE